MLDAESFGSYRLIWKLCAGGMAELFLAVRSGIEGFEKIVALKRIHPAITREPTSIQMFLDEARLAAKLDHANIVRIYDLGEIDGHFFLAMEYLPGEDLREMQYRLRELQRRTPVPIAATIIHDAAAALEFAHTLTDSSGEPLQIVHRDVSPNNVIVTYYGGVKLVDFGIAKARTSSVHTETGQFKGKFPYAAPEQLKNEPVDRRSDLWGLGVVFWELLTGKRLFSRDNPAAVIEAVKNHAIPAPSQLNSEVPPEIDRIVLRLLDRDRLRRHQSALELEADIERALVPLGGLTSPRSLALWLEGLFGTERAEAKRSIAQGKSLDQPINDILAPIRPALTPPRTTIPPPSIISSPSRTPSRPWASASAMPSSTPGSKPSRAANISTAMQSEHAFAPSVEVELDRTDAPASSSLPDTPRPRGPFLSGLLASIGSGLLLAGALSLIGFALWFATNKPPVIERPVPTATLVIESDPGGASISLNGEPTGLRTPAKLEGLAPGTTVHVRLEHSGYATRREQIELKEGNNALGPVSLGKEEP